MTRDYFELTVTLKYIPTGEIYYKLQKIGTLKAIEDEKKRFIETAKGCDENNYLASKDSGGAIEALIPFKILEKSVWYFETQRYYPTNEELITKKYE